MATSFAVSQASRAGRAGFDKAAAKNPKKAGGAGKNRRPRCFPVEFAVAERPGISAGNQRVDISGRNMRYLCQVFFEEKRLEALSTSELDALFRASADYNDLLQCSGRLALALALEPVRTATTIRIQSGRAQAMDGPFAETREQLGGVILIDATDLDEALRVAAKMPMAKLGSIEIRPVSRS
jgi:hypothetical protein